MYVLFARFLSSLPALRKQCVKICGPLFSAILLVAKYSTRSESVSTTNGSGQRTGAAALQAPSFQAARAPLHDPCLPAQSHLHAQVDGAAAKEDSQRRNLDSPLKEAYQLRLAEIFSKLLCADYVANAKKK